jgi:hypothetical protein
MSLPTAKEDHVRTARRKHLVLVVGWLAVLATGATTTGPASAQTLASPVSLALEPVSVSADADTYVVAQQPSVAHGTESRLTAANWNTPWHSESYLRFTVAPAPAGATITRARLDLTFQRLDQQPDAVDLHTVTGAWNESTTYAGRPTVGAVVATAAVDGDGATSLSFDVTSAVRAAGPYSFALRNPTAESVASVYSRESGATGPRLVIEYASSTTTLCGASFTTELPGETYQQALARVDGYYNGLEVVRVFYPGLPQAWPGKLNTGDRPMVVSFKAAPADVIAGRHDAALAEWFRGAPRDRTLWWTYFHEPENDIEAGSFTAAQFRQAWQRIAGLADAAGNSGLRATLILMGWTLEPGSGRNWRDFYPGRSHVDVLGWDLYNLSWRNGNYRPPAENFQRVVATSQAEGLPFGIAETGTPILGGDDGTARATWVRGSVEYLSAAGAQFVAYFDLNWPSAGIDYRLRDPAGQAVWREFCG